MKEKITILFFILLVAISGAVAINVDECLLVVKDLDKEVSEITYTLSLSGSGEESLQLEIFEVPNGINGYYKDFLDELNYQLVESTLNLQMDFSSKPKQTVIVKAYFQDLVKSDDGGRLLSLKQTLTMDVSVFEIVVVLPEGAVVSDVEDTTLVFPEPTSILSDGKKIILDWKETNPKDSFEIFVNYEQLDKGQPLLIYLTTTIIVLVVLAVLVIFVLRGNKKVSKVISVGLSKEEKVVYNLIKSKKEISQKDVLKQLEYSKPRLSKLIRKLEEKELIDKKPQGRTNILKIKKI